MNRRICPRCGSKKTAQILWGMPAFSDDIDKKIKNMEIVLGGCCISYNDPTYHCNTCKKDFGRPTSFDEIAANKIHFVIGGHFGGYHDVTVTRTINGAITKYMPPDDAIIDITTIGKDLSVDEWRKFIRDLFRCYIRDWRTSYIDTDYCDGTQWKLVISFDGKPALKRDGSNAYPPHWKKFMSVFRKYISKEIK